MSDGRLGRKGSPTGLLRGVLRAPIWLYRAHLGFLLGKRFVMIEHTGRVSGRPRRTILEVVDLQPDCVYVMAGWGPQADWYRNLQVDAGVRVHLGRRVWSAIAIFCDEAAARRALSEYGRRHPGTLRRLGGLMLDNSGLSVADTIEALASTLPVVGLPRS